MRNIAVACMADGSISHHMGRCTHLRIFSVSGADIQVVTTACLSPVIAAPRLAAARVAAEHPHGHDRLLGALDGCSAILSGGMGAGIAGTLSAHGVTPIVVAGEHTPESAVVAYLRGDLQTGEVHACCGHAHGDA